MVDDRVVLRARSGEVERRNSAAILTCNTGDSPTESMVFHVCFYWSVTDDITKTIAYSV